MPKPTALLGQLAVYALVAALLGIFSTSPAYRHFPADKAQLMISFSHVGKRAQECRKLSREEIAKLAANMRRAEICSRERQPVRLELALSGELIYRATLPPTGLSGDGAAQAYRSFEVDPGAYRLEVRLSDDDKRDGFEYSAETEVALAPGDNYVIDFRSELGGFIFDAGKPTGGRAVEGAGK